LTLSVTYGKVYDKTGGPPNSPVLKGERGNFFDILNEEITEIIKWIYIYSGVDVWN
jgi:hypothetical protein